MPRADATLRGSNRPIYLFSPIGKLLKHFLLRLINRIFQERRILKDCKFGDRAKHSTTHCLGAFTTYVTDDFKFKMEIIAISLDFPKVFDTIWQHAIFFPNFIVWIRLTNLSHGNKFPPVSSLSVDYKLSEK